MKPWSNLAKVVYARTYSRNDNGTQESWKRTVERAIRGNINTVDPKYLQPNEAERLEHFLLNRAGGPAGRGWWYSGSPSHEKIGGVALNNCWGLVADEWEKFVIAQDLLMLGGGVGMSVEHRFVSRLPKVIKALTVTRTNSNDADFIVPDSREGWCELTRRVLEAFFVTGKSFSYSTVCLRGAGEKLKGFGGVSSGPIPLVIFVEKMVALLNTRAGTHVRPIDAGDMLCCIGELVVSGNVRRSALLLQGDAWDKEYLVAKRWDLGSIPTYRAMANYSVVVDAVEDLHPLFWETYEQGEAFGIVNRKNIQQYGRMGEHKADKNAVIVNPCVSGDTEILTRQGYIRIDSLVGEKVTIWNGFEWSTVTPAVTGTNQPMLTIQISTGQKLRCTTAHKWVRERASIATWNEVERVRADELVVGDYLLPWRTPDGQDVVQQIVKIEESGIEPVVYCFTEPKRNLGCFNGIVTGQCAEATLEGNGEPCNLQEIPLPNLKDEAEFIEVSRLMHRWGKRVTLESYHHPRTQEVIERNRRVGTGITGCLQSPLFTPATLDRAYAAIQDENSAYSKQLGINESIRTTVVKPSGTLSKMFDCLPGIHAAYSQFMIQRIRFASNDPLIPLLKAAGHRMEPVQRFDGSLDHNTLVVEFYVSWDDSVPTADRDFDTWKQLDTLLLAQRHWADQAVSVTVYYKREEIPQLKHWLSENLKHLKTISFLCHSDHGFKQAPMEAITREQYLELAPTVSPIDINNIGSGEIESLECEGGACPIK